MLLDGLIHSFLRRIILEPFCTFLYSLVSYIQPTVWWWVLYIIECDVIVIVSLRFGDRSSLSHFDPGRGCLGETPQHPLTEAA